MSNEIKLPIEQDKAAYRLADAQRQSELIALTECDSVDLGAECGLLRLLIREAIEDGDIELANKMISTLSRTSKYSQEMSIRDSQLLGRRALDRWSHGIIRIVESAIKGRFSGAELVLDKVKGDILNLLTDTQNSPKEIRELT